MLYGNIDGTKIVEVVSAGKGYQHKNLETIILPDDFQGLAGDDTRQFDEAWNYLPISVQVNSGVVTLDPHLKLDGETLVEKTVSEMVKDGTIVLNEREKLVGEQIVPKTLEELVADGVEKIDRYKKADGDTLVDKTDAELMRDGLKEITLGYKLNEVEKEVYLVPMTIDERLAARQITEEEAIAEKNTIVIKQRKEAYQEESDPLTMEMIRGEIDLTLDRVPTLEDIRIKVAEIKSRYPKES